MKERRRRGTKRSRKKKKNVKWPVSIKLSVPLAKGSLNWMTLITEFNDDDDDKLETEASCGLSCCF